MGIDLRALLAVLLDVWGTLAVGIIPVVLGWFRIIGQWRTTRKVVTSKALNVLTASLCVVQAGDYTCRALTVRTQGTFPVYWILFGFFAFGFILTLAACVLALRERNAARSAVLAGSIAVAAVSATSLIWFLIAIIGS